ncbi:Gfo/Idh/MocA family oxidoreductase [Phytomonospora sp. NPDC050363]|uniref:Gfo/Idh/MocA family protein n=1 Tax=Phytomonospora sp. NPDC050363 TaxID=3155642 RepID=UPI0033E97F8B
MSDNRKIRLGVIGLGAMGGHVLASARDHADLTVTAAADLDPATVDRHRATDPGVVFTTDPAAVVASDDVDAVYIATPPAFHAELAVAALRRGLAVFCEKPLAISEADGRAMLAAAEEAGVACAVNFALSDRAAVLEIERALGAGEAGDVVGVDVRLRFPAWPRDFQADARWLDGRAQGGFVREVFSHFAYLTDRLLGPIEPVAVSLDYAEGAAETAARGHLVAGGVPVHLSAFSGLAGPETYEWVLWGSRRSYMLQGWSRLLVSEGGDWEPVALTGEPGGEPTRLAAFARAVRGGGHVNLADFDAGRRVQRVVEAFHNA